MELVLLIAIFFSASILPVFLPTAASWCTYRKECNFGIPCTCQYDNHDALDSIDCKIEDELPVFSGDHEISLLNLTGKVDKFLDNFLSGLKSIGLLNITQTSKPQPIKIQWSDEAFGSVSIDRLLVRNLDGVIPPPEAVKRLGRKGLHTFIVENANEPVSLEANTFSDFPELYELYVSDVPISNIDEAAFASLEDRYFILQLSSGSLKTFPRHALKPLITLYDLDISNNGLTDFSSDDFATFPRLYLLTLSGNKLQETIDQGTLNLPRTLEWLSMRQTGLTKVPTDLISNASLPNLISLDLSDNEITSLKEDDFLNCNVELLYLDGNPISQIEGESLKRLELTHLGLSRTRLTSFDLSISNKMTSGTLDLTDNPYLKRVDATSMIVPDSEKNWGLSIALRNSGIEEIDPKLEEIMKAGKYPYVELSENKHIICDASIRWIAKYALNSTRIKIDDTICANTNEPMRMYLEKSVPEK